MIVSNQYRMTLQYHSAAQLINCLSEDMQYYSISHKSQLLVIAYYACHADSR